MVTTLLDVKPGAESVEPVVALQALLGINVAEGSLTRLLGMVRTLLVTQATACLTA